MPRVGGNWGVCDPADPRNRRRRCSLLIEGRTGASEPTRIVIDTGCDLREQLLDAAVDRLDAVLYTHEHADHTHGIDDLRVLALNNRRRVEVYFSREAGEHIVQSFAYCFTAPPGSGYPPILNQNLIAAGEPLVITGPGGDIEILPFEQEHGEINSLGFRIGGFAYSCDLSGIPDEFDPRSIGPRHLGPRRPAADAASEPSQPARSAGARRAAPAPPRGPHQSPHRSRLFAHRCHDARPCASGL